MTKKRELMFSIVRGLLAILIALLVATLLIFISANGDNFSEKLASTGDALKQMLVGPLFRMGKNGTRFETKRLTDILASMIPIIFTGLSVCIMFSANQFNLGAEGGIMLGAFVTGMAAIYLPMAAGLHPIVAILLGGLAVGESTQTMYDIIDAVEPYMPKDKTRYLMGVGTPSNIIEGVARGVDFFDCVMPARNARHAKLFTWEGAINLKNAKYERDMQPIDPACDCPVCRRYSRAYLRHLFKAEEMLAMRLSVMHNLYFYNKLMERIRQALDEGRFEEFRRTYSERLDRRI